MSSRRGRLPGDVKNNLPGDVTKFVDRERELGELLQAWHDTRFLSLLGPAGVGKSRLALQLATRVRRQFPDGAWLVRLGPVDDGGLLPGVIAGALGIPEGGRGAPRHRGHQARVRVRLPAGPAAPQPDGRDRLRRRPRQPGCRTDIREGDVRPGLGRALPLGAPLPERIDYEGLAKLVAAELRGEEAASG